MILEPVLSEEAKQLLKVAKEIADSVCEYRKKAQEAKLKGRREDWKKYSQWAEEARRDLETLLQAVAVAEMRKTTKKVKVILQEEHAN